MIERFKDTRNVEAHYDFQRWRSKFPDGFFLHRMSSQKARLHKSLCPNCEDPARKNDRDWNLTAKEKICSIHIHELEDWAAKEGSKQLIARIATSDPNRVSETLPLERTEPT